MLDREAREQAVKNEAIFREVNERVAALDEAHAISKDEPWEFLCECGNADCTEHVSLTLAEYERARSDPTLFAVLPGHEIPEVEVAVEETDRYVLAKKRPGEREIARQTDPRADDRTA